MFYINVGEAFAGNINVSGKKKERERERKELPLRVFSSIKTKPGLSESVNIAS
jgi:hypothetical protein